MHRDKEQKKAAFERQVAVNEDDDRSNLQNFNQEVIDDIVRLSESTQQNTFKPPFAGDFDSNANVAERETKNIRVTPPGHYGSNANFPFEFQN